MNDEQMLRERLSEVPVPPLGFGVDQVVTEGFRRIRRRRMAAVGAAVVVSLAVLAGVPALLHDDRSRGSQLPAAPAPTPSPSPSPAALSCQVAGALPAPKDAGPVQAVATDPAGRYVVGNGTEGQNFVPYLWDGGKVRRVPFSGASGEMLDVNSAGVAIGRGSDGQGGPETFFRYAGDELTELAMPSGQWQTNGWPQINTAGDIVATVQPATSYEGRGARVLVWPAGSATPEQQPLDKDADAFDIADDGTIAGVLRHQPDERTLAYLWDRTGKGRELQTPNDFSSTAYAISSDGAWATGGLVLTLDGSLYRDGKPATFAGQRGDVTVGALADTGAIVDRSRRTWRC